MYYLYSMLPSMSDEVLVRLTVCFQVPIFDSCTRTFLGRVAVSTVIAAYSHKTFPVTICRSVSVLSVQYIVENGRSDPDAVWHRRSEGSMDETGSWVWGSVNGNG